MAARAPHAPNAALLIDFDNVTMGMRSDLSKELKTLLSSEVFRGKVTVQRAYADWRRYPQYIVPLSESSIDLIFAPAYGSSKKNATDIRMAIDGIELVFTRPEIGTFILLTGDSDFSSLVLKLKEYGKYVIGVGIQESSSDILVQNCDEYYSYTALSGLRKTDEIGVASSDPWVLIERAAEQMSRKGDVMRSDRLKQVMLEMDSNFDEKTLGYSKFSRFVTEAARKGLIETHKLENGQVEIRPAKGGKKGEERKSAPAREGRERRPDRKRPSGSSRTAPAEVAPQGEQPAAPTAEAPEGSSPPDSESISTSAEAPRAPGSGASLGGGYALLRRAISEISSEQGVETVRDSDIKRRMLLLEPGFSEGALGFPKFSRFLRQAHDHTVVEMKQGEGGSFQVALGATDGVEHPFPEAAVPAAGEPSAPAAAGGRGSGRGTRGPKGTVVPAPAEVPVAAMDLPTGRDAVIQYLTAYDGVGRKTAETLVDAFGDDRIFGVFDSEPSRVAEHLPPARAEKVLEGWRLDLMKRRGGAQEGGAAPSTDPEATPAVPSGLAASTDGELSADSAPVAESTPAGEEETSGKSPSRSWGRRPRRTRSSGE
jgi:uncharacterized protein (TIGR00288 family)